MGSGISKLRIDSGVVEGDEVSVHYDPMLAKIVSWGTTRRDAIRRLDLAIKSTHIGGIATNLQLIRSCLAHKSFQEDAGVSTHFIEQHMDELLESLEGIDFLNIDNDRAKIALYERLLSEYFLKVHFPICIYF